MTMDGFRISEDHGRVLENIVFIELKRRGYEVFYYNDTKECDFIVRKGPHTQQAIQCEFDLISPNHPHHATFVRS